MKKKIILGFILLFCFQISLYAQSGQDSSLSDISLRTYVQDQTVALNREVVYEVELKWQGDLSRFKITEALEPDVTNLTVRGTGSTNRITTDSNGKEISIKKITYYFKPIEIGMAYINGVTIRYEDTILNSKESLLASRLSVKIVEPIPEDDTNSMFKNILYIILLGLFIFLTIYLIYNYKKRKKENELKELESVKETIEEKYLRLLKETIHLAGNNYKEKLTDLTHLILGYYSEKFATPLNSMSTKDVLAFLQEKSLEPNLLTKLEDFLTKSDLIRFAGNKLTEADFHQLYDSVEWILEKNKMEKSEKEVE